MSFSRIQEAASVAAWTGSLQVESAPNRVRVNDAALIDMTVATGTSVKSGQSGPHASLAPFCDQPLPARPVSTII